MLALRVRARARRRYARWSVAAYMTDAADAHALARALGGLHAALGVTGWRRLLRGQPSAALEAHHSPARPGVPAQAWLAVSCAAGDAEAIEAALRVAYPNLRLERRRAPLPAATRAAAPAKAPRVHPPDPDRSAAGAHRAAAGHERDPHGARLVSRAGARPDRADAGPGGARVGGEAAVRAPRGATGPPSRRPHRPDRPPARCGGRAARRARRTAHRPVLLRHPCRGGEPARVRADRRGAARAARREPSRRDAGHRRAPGLPDAVRAGCPRRGQPAAGAARAVFAPLELAELWQLPSVDFTAVPFARAALPLAPAPPGVHRPREGAGMLRDELGAVSIHLASAPAAHRGARDRRPGQVELPRRERRRGPAARALRRDRARPEGRRGRRRAELVPAGPRRARCSTWRARRAGSTRSPSTRPPT